jgi:hypothetical protein
MLTQEGQGCIQMPHEYLAPPGLKFLVTIKGGLDVVLQPEAAE